MFDLQINGYAGADFNSSALTAEEFDRACAALEIDGVDEILATIITDDLDTMCGRLKKLVEYREQNTTAKRLISGFHIEGPFINPEKGYVGAHPPHAVKPASVEAAKKLVEASSGLAKLITLAPEYDDGYATTAWLTNQGIKVAAGHCNPSLDQLNAACDHGLSLFTHLGNGCPMLMHRHDNIIQRALALKDRLWLCFIPDGVHVEFYSLKNYLACAGLERCVFVTDAISAARLGPGRYSLAGWDLNVGEDLVARSPDGSHFVGSTVTWPRIQGNAEAMGLTTEQMDLLCKENPRRAMGLI